MIFKILTIVSCSFVGVTSLIVGVIYATRKQFMKYHKEAIGVDWNEIDKKHINNNNGSYENRWF